MKTKNITVQCPCCENRVEPKEMKQTFSLIPFDGLFIRIGQSFEDSFLEITQSYSSYFRWACDHCISGDLAILADPNKQFYTLGHPLDSAMPYLAYFDRSYRCRECKERVVFSKEKQLHWYEELQLIVYTRPTLCKVCGRKKSIHIELSNLLKDGRPTDKSQLLRIAEIYEEMGKTAKSKAYRKWAKK